MSAVVPPGKFRLNVTGAELSCFSRGRELRAVIHIDVDFFEVQLCGLKRGEKEIPFKQPVVVVNRDGVILSVNHLAKTKLGIDRNMSKRELKVIERKNPSLLIWTTGTRFNSTDTFTPVVESDRILSQIMLILNSAADVPVERASVDVFFIEVGKPVEDDKIDFPASEMLRWLPRIWKTRGIYKGNSRCFLEAAKRTYVGDQLSDYRAFRRAKAGISGGEELLLRAAALALHLVKVIARSGYSCSAGVGPNKQLAKIACEMHRPQGLTVLTQGGFQRLSPDLHFPQLHGLKSKMGERLAEYYSKSRWGRGNELSYIAQLRDLPLGALTKFFKRTYKPQQALKKAEELFNSIRGEDQTPVIHKLFDDKMSFTHSFRGALALKTRSKLLNAMNNLARDFWDRVKYVVKIQRRFPWAVVAKFEMGSIVSLTKRWDIAKKPSVRRQLDGEDGKEEINASTIFKMLMTYVDDEEYLKNAPEDILRVKLSADTITPIRKCLNLPFWVCKMLSEEEGEEE